MGISHDIKLHFFIPDGTKAGHSHWELIRLSGYVRARQLYRILSQHHRTVKIALLLVTLPARLLTITEKRAPLSLVVVGGVVYDALVAPVMFTPFFVH
jgi:hypothetical protein